MVLSLFVFGLVGPAPRPRVTTRRASAPTAVATSDVEDALLRLPAGQAADADQLISSLISAGGIDDPALSPVIEGDWTLLQTSSSEFDLRNPLGRRVDGTSPGLEGAIAAITGGEAVQVASSSPIQRAITQAFSVVQTIRLTGSQPRVVQIVNTPLGPLTLGAKARVDASQPQRISFMFDEGYLQLAPPASLRVPYPVPFKLLGKEAEGYLDTLYLSERLRISRGNKGTTFVLAREGAAGAK